MASKSSRPLGQESSQPAPSVGEEDGDMMIVMMMNDDVDDQAFCEDDGAVTLMVTK